MLKSERDLRSAISREIALYAAAGATVAWGGGPRVTEAVIRRGDVVRRVVFSKSPGRHDRTAVIGRVRRVLRDVGVDDVATHAVVVKPKPRRPSQGDRIKALEATVAALVTRVAEIEEQTGRRRRA